MKERGQANHRSQMIQLFRTRHVGRVVVLAATLPVVACGIVPTSPTTGITRERAIEIARSSVGFDPTSVDGSPPERYGL